MVFFEKTVLSPPTPLLKGGELNSANFLNESPDVRNQQDLAPPFSKEQPNPTGFFEEKHWFSKGVGLGSPPLRGGAGGELNNNGKHSFFGLNPQTEISSSPKLPPFERGGRGGLLLAALVFFFFSRSSAQNTPICNTPYYGSSWSYLGPLTAPAPGPGARPGNTGTGAQMRVMFTDPTIPNPQTLYACTPTGGLFRTKNVLDSMPVWENLTDSSRLPILGVQDVEFVPGNPDVMFIGTGIRYPLDMQRTYGIGILKSTDGGRNWNPTGLTFKPTGGWETVCHDILINPENPDVIHALCGKHYYKSTDGGETFVLKKESPHPCPAGWSGAFRDIVFKPGDPRTIYLSTDASYFFISKDEGETWTETNVMDEGVPTDVARMDIAVSPRNPELVYLACRTKTEVVLRSADGGKTWEVVFDRNLNTSYEKHAFVVSPNDENVAYLGGLYIYQVSIAEGKGDQKLIGGYDLHLDHRDLAVVDDGNGKDVLYSANDGGLYRGTPGEKAWKWRDVSGYGMNNMQFYGIAVAEDFSVVPGGTQDLGIMLIYRDGSGIKPAVGGDGTDCAVDFYGPGLMYGISWAIGPPTIHRSANGGLNWSGSFQKGLAGSGDVYYYQLAAHENGCFYVGLKDVFRLPFKGDTWEQIGDIPLPTDLPWKITAMSVCRENDDVIYAYGDQLYKTENANAPAAEVAWAALGKKMGDAADPFKYGSVIGAVEVDAAKGERVWVGFRNYASENKVWFSGDGGETWTNVSAGLPPFPVNALAFQAGTSDALYAGTDVGVFYNPTASDPGSEWLCFNNGLPVCLVSDLEINYCYNTLVAGTFGRGIWASPMAEASQFQPIEINSNTTWGNKILRSDVVVKKGNTLTMTGEIRLATGCKIVVENKAGLVLDGAKVKDLCGLPWQGIVVEDEKNSFWNFLFGSRRGKVALSNGAVLEGAENGFQP